MYVMWYMSDALDLYILKYIGHGRSLVLCSIDLCLAISLNVGKSSCIRYYGIRNV